LIRTALQGYTSIGGNGGLEKKSGNSIPPILQPGTFARSPIEKGNCGRGWADEIDNFRLELEILFQSKTLYNYGASRLDIIYDKAKRSVIKKTGLSVDTFPQVCPYTFAEIIDFDFLPV
jgi:hypothetical protein